MPALSAARRPSSSFPPSSLPSSSCSISSACASSSSSPSTVAVVQMILATAARRSARYTRQLGGVVCGVVWRGVVCGESESGRATIETIRLIDSIHS